MAKYNSDSDGIPSRKIVTTLSSISQTSLNTFANAVGKKFWIDPELRLFAAYFCGVKHVVNDSNFWGNKEGQLKLHILETMKGKDFLETMRVLFKDPTEETIIELTGCNIDFFERNNDVTIDSKMLPEYGLVREQISGRYITRTNGFIELLKMPQRARTFYAGVIANNYDTDNPKLPKYKISLSRDTETVPFLDISSQSVVAYANNRSIHDYAQYVRLAKGQDSIFDDNNNRNRDLVRESFKNINNDKI